MRCREWNLLVAVGLGVSLSGITLTQRAIAAEEEPGTAQRPQFSMSGSPVTASASTPASALYPAIEITKEPPSQTVYAGEIATFTITVNNIGEGVLSNLAVSDPLTPDCDWIADEETESYPPETIVSYTCKTGPLFADLRNVATVSADHDEIPERKTPGTASATTRVSASSTAFVQVIDNPIVAIRKTPHAPRITAGETATFTITVRNLASTPLSSVVITDDLTPACTLAIGDLPAASSMSYVCTSEALWADFTNVATLSARQPDGSTLKASAAADVAVTAPEIVIHMTPDRQRVLAGETATFTVTVTNPAASGIKSGLAVSDPLAPACARPAGSLPDLGPGESTSYPCTSESVSADFLNVATVTADSAGTLVSASDAAFVDAITAVEISKTPAEQELLSGQRADFTIRVTNNSRDSLANITVSDPLTPDCERPTGSLTGLNPGESHSYACASTPLSVDSHSTATVTADSPAGQLTATARAFVHVRKPIEITKSPDSQAIAPGATAEFLITVTNDGDVAKTQVAVADPQTPDCARPVGTLPDLPPHGGRSSYTCRTGPLSVALTNEARVTAESPAGPVEATDTALVRIAGQPIEIRTTPKVQETTAGDAATFNITVTNVGETLQSQVAVSDPQTPACERPAGTLQDLSAGESVAYTCSTEPLSESFTNTATVSAELASGATASHTDTARVDVVPRPVGIPTLAWKSTALTCILLGLSGFAMLRYRRHPRGSAGRRRRSVRYIDSTVPGHRPGCRRTQLFQR